MGEEEKFDPAWGVRKMQSEGVGGEGGTKVTLTLLQSKVTKYF